MRGKMPGGILAMVGQHARRWARLAALQVTRNNWATTSLPRSRFRLWFE
jgi:hypothetical protein